MRMPCLPNKSQMMQCLCPAKAEKKELKALVQQGVEKVEELKDATDKAGNKTTYVERRMMNGQQGYRVGEAFRQVSNCFDEWDPQRSESYFSGVVISEFLKYSNAKGGQIQPDPDIWR